jgi:hypothetical protein
LARLQLLIAQDALVGLPDALVERDRVAAGDEVNAWRAA